MITCSPVRETTDVGLPHDAHRVMPLLQVGMALEPAMTKGTVPY